MPSWVTIYLEVPQYLKKYLLALYGPEEPIFFPKKSDYNRFLIHHLGIPPEDFVPPEFCEDKARCRGCESVCVRKHREKYIEIVLPYTDIKDLKTYFYLSRDDKALFRKELEADFIFDYHHDIKEKMSLGFDRKTATLLFMEMHNIIEDDRNFGDFYRDFSRMLVKRRLNLCKSEEKNILNYFQE